MNFISIEKESVIKDFSEFGYSFVSSHDFWISLKLNSSAEELWQSWDTLEPDYYLKGNNIFRFRRYGKFRLDINTGLLFSLPESTYYQSLQHNTYAGGIVRNLSPLLPSIQMNEFLHSLILFNHKLLYARPSRRKKNYTVGVHQMRIIASQGQYGEPTPEGIHRDGHDFNVIHFVRKSNVSGGLSRVYNSNKKILKCINMRNTLDSLYLDDKQVFHDVSPIYQNNKNFEGFRDVMTINFTT